LLGLMILCGSAPHAAGAIEDDFEQEFEELPQRKRPSLWHRPAKDSPAEQLAYAEKLRSEGAARKALRQYRALVHKWHDAPEAVTAQFRYAALLDERERYRQAFDEYQYLVDNAAQNFDYEDVLERQFRIANHIRTVRHGRLPGLRGFATPERALPLFEQIVANAPNWDRAAECQFFIGLIHEGEESYDLAAAAYEKVQLRYRDSDFAPTAAFRRADCLRRIADKYPRDEESTKRALSALSGFILDYPASPDAERARQQRDALKERLAEMCFERAVFYDRTAGRPESAVIAYTDFLSKFPTSHRKAEAEARLSALKKEVENEEK